MQAYSPNRLISAPMLLALVLAAGGPGVSAQEEAANPQARIANGVETFGFPSTVTLITPPSSDPSSGFSFCSGELIGCSTVLTAAHCVCTTSGANCQAGGPDLLSPAEIAVAMQNERVINAASVHVPANYVFGSQADVAIVKLASPVNGIRPTRINDTVFAPFGTPGIIAGYGITNQTLNDNGIKRAGNMVTTACSGGISDDEHLCWTFPGTASAGPPGTDSNTCPGDSGGPLFMDFGSGLRVAGVTSGGPNACHTADNPFDTDIFVNRVFVQNTAGADLNNTSCGPLPQAGETGTTIIPFAGTIDNTRASEQVHSFTVPAGTSELRTVINGTQEGIDIDLYLRFGAPPTDDIFDCRPFDFGNFEACVVPNPTPGTWFARVARFSGSNPIRYHLISTLFGSGGGGGGSGSAALSNISYNGFVNEVIRPAFIQLATAQVVITAETLGLPDPRVSLKRISDSSTVAFNDNCDEPGIAALIGRPLTTPSQDACIVRTLSPGAYFFEVTGSGVNATGNVLAGVTQPAGSTAALQNISYNGFVSATGIRPAFSVASAGKFVITAENIGLPNPQVSLKRISDSSTVAFNDNCADPNIVALIGRPLTTAFDACIVVDNLAPGTYFVEVSDVGGGSGNALVGATQILD